MSVWSRYVHPFSCIRPALVSATPTGLKQVIRLQNMLMYALYMSTFTCWDQRHRTRLLLAAALCTFSVNGFL
jgi:hypothetical protein